MSDFNLLPAHWTGQTTITWSIATQNFPGQPGGSFSNRIIDQRMIDDIARAFAIWDAASGLSFEHVADSADVDIRFGGAVIDGPGGRRFAEAAPAANGGSLTAVSIRFDVEENLSIQNDHFYMNFNSI